MNRAFRDTKTHERLVDTTKGAYAEERIAHLLRLCARGFNRSLARQLAEQDISFGQWVFMRILWKKEGLTQRELSELANLTEPTVHTALAKLEKLNVVTRRTENGNRRKQHVYLTERGRSLQDVLEPLAVRVNEKGLEGLNEKDHDRLHGMLLTILSNLTREETEAEAVGLKVPPTRGFCV